MTFFIIIFILALENVKEQDEIWNILIYKKAFLRKFSVQNQVQVESPRKSFNELDHLQWLARSQPSRLFWGATHIYCRHFQLQKKKKHFILQLAALKNKSLLVTKVYAVFCCCCLSRLCWWTLCECVRVNCQRIVAYF